MFTWPIVLLVVLGISSLVGAGIMSLRLHAFSGKSEVQDDEAEPYVTP